jgi:hypothetical protein
MIYKKEMSASYLFILWSPLIELKDLTLARVFTCKTNKCMLLMSVHLYTHITIVVICHLLDAYIVVADY